MTGSYTDTDELDLKAGIGQRLESVKWNVLGVDRTVLFSLSNVDASHPAEISFDGNSNTQRTLHGLRVGPAEAARIDPIVHRLQPSWVLASGTSYPLGLFLFSSANTPIDSGGNVLMADLYDQSVILNQQRASTFSLSAGTPVTVAIAQLVAELGLTAYASIDSSAVVTGANVPVSWSLGTAYGVILSDLALAGGLFPPYFDNNGFLRFRAVPNPISTAPADLTFLADVNSRIIAGTITTSTDLITAPNRYIVRGSGTGAFEVVGTYDVPASAPHSKEHIGYVRTAPIIDNQAVSTSTTAQAAAQAAYATDYSTYDWVQFHSAPDPRDDGYQIVNFLGTNYREQSWTLRLTPGGPHTHSARKVYV